MAGGRDCSQEPHLLEGETRLLVLPWGLLGAAPLRPRRTSAMTRVSAFPPRRPCGRGAFSVYTLIEAAPPCTRVVHTHSSRDLLWWQWTSLCLALPRVLPRLCSPHLEGQGEHCHCSVHVHAQHMQDMCRVGRAPPPSRRGSVTAKPGGAWRVHARCSPHRSDVPTHTRVVSPA